MDKFLTEVVESIPTVIKNTRFNVNLNGWPAAASIFAVCGTVIAVSAINSQNL